MKVYVLKFENINKIFTAKTEEEVIELEWKTGQNIEWIKEQSL